MVIEKSKALNCKRFGAKDIDKKSFKQLTQCRFLGRLCSDFIVLNFVYEILVLDANLCVKL